MLALFLTLFSSPNFAADAETATAAENARWRSAVFWTGQPLAGNWSQPCPVVRRDTNGAGGGATRFLFDRGEVYGWSMTVEGRQGDVLESVIPHEVDHMVRATLVRRRVIRWLDEGSAALFESEAEHQRLRTTALRFAQSGSTPSFLHLGEYPSGTQELTNLYAVGFSLVEYLLKKDGPEKLLALQADAEPFDAALPKHYRLSSDQLIQNWRRDVLSHSAVDCQSNACRFHTPSERVVGCRRTPCTAENRLIIWTASWCGACQKFWADFHARDEFRQALTSRFHIHIADADRYPLQARQHRIQALPTFVTTNARVTGYQGHEWLLSQLGGSTSPLSSTGSTSPPSSNSPSTHEDSTGSQTIESKPVDIASKESDANALGTQPLDESKPLPATVDREVDPPACPTPTHERVYRLLGVALTAAEWAGLAGATTGPVGIALAAISLWRRRRTNLSTQTLQRPSEVPPLSTPQREAQQSLSHAPFPRRLDEARELLLLRQREGRVAALDAIRGMVVDDELDRLATSGQAEFAAQLKRQLDDRVQQIAPIATGSEE